jgi:tetratricopeptide (TPR) repeat protein
VAFTDPFAAFQEGRYADAIAVFDGWMRPRGEPVPRDSIAGAVLWYHGLSAAHLGRYDVAIADIQTLLERGVARERGDSITLPFGTNEVRYLLALLAERVNQPLDAIRLYREALENDLGLYMAHVKLARIYEAAQEWDSALAESRAAVMTNPEDPSLLLDHGIILTEAGYLAAAEDTLLRAMEVNPRDSRVPYFLGVAQHAMSKTAEARATFERFLSLAPSRYQRQIRDAQERLARLR